MPVNELAAWKWTNGWLRTTVAPQAGVVFGAYQYVSRTVEVMPFVPGYSHTGTKFAVLLNDFVVDPRSIQIGTVGVLVDHLEGGWSLTVEGKAVAKGAWT